MRSPTRIACDYAVKKFADTLSNNRGNLLYCGIAGDPKETEYGHLFPTYKITTFDKDPKWNPEIVGDITGTPFKTDSFDLIVCVQVIEHIPNLWDLPDELYWNLKPDGYLIIDCPFNFPYHAEPPSFGDYWRITKDGFKILFNKELWELVDLIDTNINTSCLFKKI